MAEHTVAAHAGEHDAGNAHRVAMLQHFAAQVLHRGMPQVGCVFQLGQHGELASALDLHHVGAALGDIRTAWF